VEVDDTGILLISLELLVALVVLRYVEMNSEFAFDG
jgi:hypothetical protein